MTPPNPIDMTNNKKDFANIVVFCIFVVYYSYVADNFEKSLQPHSVFGTATAINCLGF
jgi:hypothetical protein